MDRIINCSFCGLEFTAKHHHQLYCSFECKEQSRNQKRRKGYKPKPGNGTSVSDIMRIAEQLSKERGEYLQYGDVQREILTGKLKIKDGVIVK